MTREEKELLLKDLCARLPYGVKVDINFYDNTKELNCSLLQDYIVSEKSLRPYLRSMSSMTEDEYAEWTSITEVTHLDNGWEVPCMSSIDWLNAHHFDYRGLIPMGLAIEAPKNMYKL